MHHVTFRFSIILQEIWYSHAVPGEEHQNGKYAVCTLGGQWSTKRCICSSFTRRLSRPYKQTPQDL